MTQEAEHSRQPLRARRVAVIGGGISGLAAAHRLAELRPELELTLFESDERLGGVLRTERRDGFLVEHSADMFTTQEPWALQLCQRIGLADELIQTDERYRRALIVHRGKLYPVPMGFSLLQPQQIWPLLTTPLLSVRGKLRLLGERWIRPQQLDDESLCSFATRRFGREAYERLIQPLVGGIYTADPLQLSMRATLERFRKLEREHGSLIKAALRRPDRNSATAQAERAASGARYAIFVAPREGMSSLVERLAQRLPQGTVRTSCVVRRLAQQPDGTWQIDYEDRQSANAAQHQADAVVLAGSAHRMASLLHEVRPALADQLRSIPLAGAAIVIAAFRRDQIAHPLNAFGFVVPLVEKRPIFSASFASIKFPGRAPDGHVLVRIFVGGACQPEMLELEDKQIERVAIEDFGRLLQVQGPPLWASVRRWEHAMPQYHLGHIDRVAHIERLTGEVPGLALAGNAYRGVGIPFCIRSGEQAADETIAFLKSGS